MDEYRDWMWLLMTDKGDFFVTVSGRWTQVEAVRKVRAVFDKLKIDIVGLIPRKRSTGPDDIQCTIYELPEPEDGREFYFLAGRKLWEACGRAAEYDVQLVLQKLEIEMEAK